MKYKVDTRELFTDNGLFVKKMQCQISQRFENILFASKQDCKKNNKFNLAIPHLRILLDKNHGVFFY
jgi:hypothetical protein